MPNHLKALHFTSLHDVWYFFEAFGPRRAFSGTW